MLDKYPQVRLATEVLWAFTGGAPSPGETVFNSGYRRYLSSVYHEILGLLGVSYEDLLIAQVDNEDAIALRQRLSVRLGVESEDVLEFLLPDPPTEDQLATLFALRPISTPISTMLPPSQAAMLRSSHLGRYGLMRTRTTIPMAPSRRCLLSIPG